MDKPAALGGEPIFKEVVPIVSPPLNKYNDTAFLNRIKEILDSGMVTNYEEVKKFEKMVENYLKVNNAVAVSSCTSGLILTLQSLGIREKEVVIPAFTFLATAHAAYWNRCKITFVDIDPSTLNISINDLQEKISKKTAAIIPVHIYGNPCNIKALEELANDYNAKLIFDSAHAFGASYNGEKVGNFGEAEVFSCSPTKLLITMEGGIVTTNDHKLADNIKLARNYGNVQDNECLLPGLNARMTEINAFLGQRMLEDIDKIVENRNKYAEIYQKNLSRLPGIKFQKITEKATHSYKDFCIIIDPIEFGLNRDILAEALAEENIMTKKYFYPPVHKISAYKDNSVNLPITEFVSSNVLSLPIYSFMDKEMINKICLAIERIYEYKEEIIKII